MEIVVDTDAGTVVLATPDDLRRFSVRSVPGPADPAVVGRLLEAQGVGRTGGTGHAFIPPDAVRRLAAGAVGEGWEEEFQAMCAYAVSKGWVDPGDGALQAHLVAGEPSG